MPNRSPASALPGLFYCAICLAALELQGQEQNPKQVIVIETWVVVIDFVKLRSLDLTMEQLETSGRTRTIKIVDVLEGKANNAQILQRPKELLKVLRQAGVVQVLHEPRLAATSGRKATLEVGDSENSLKIEAMPIAKANGQIQMDFRVEVNEKMPAPRGLQALFNRTPPGNRQSGWNSVLETESGMVSLDATIVRGMPNSATPIPIVLVRATIETPGLSPPTVTTANATDRAIR